MCVLVGERLQEEVEEVYRGERDDVEEQALEHVVPDFGVAVQDSQREHDMEACTEPGNARRDQAYDHIPSEGVQQAFACRL